MREFCSPRSINRKSEYGSNKASSLQCRLSEHLAQRQASYCFSDGIVQGCCACSYLGVTKGTNFASQVWDSAFWPAGGGCVVIRTTLKGIQVRNVPCGSNSLSNYDNSFFSTSWSFCDSALVLPPHVINASTTDERNSEVYRHHSRCSWQCCRFWKLKYC